MNSPSSRRGDQSTVFEQGWTIISRRLHCAWTWWDHRNRLNLSISFTNMEVLSSPNITRAAVERPRKKGRKRRVRTSGNAKQRTQAKKRKRTTVTSKNRSDKSSEETINVVTTIEPSLVSSNCNAKATKKEGKENHELAQKVADSLSINSPIDNDESLIDEEIVKLFT